MKKGIKRCFTLMLCFVLIMGCLPSLTAHADGITLNIGTPVEGVQFTFSWSKVDGAEYYEYSVRNKTFNNTLYYDHERTTKRSAQIYYGDIWAGCEFRFWVGAYDAAGNEIAQAQVERTSIKCNHDETEEKIIGDPDRTCQDDYVHNNIYVYEIVCVVCGSTVDSDVNTGTQPHDFTDDEVCRICGYSRWVDCTEEDHNNDDNLKFTKYGPVRLGTDLGNGTHEVTFLWKVTCNKCGDSWEEQLPEVSGHIWNDNGDCDACDYRAGCDHTYVKEIYTIGNWIAEDEKTHARQITYKEVCSNPACGDVKDSTAFPVDKEEEDHDFSDNTCTKCGYSRTVPDISISVTVSSSTAKTGDMIEAVCHVTNGSGDHSISWMIYRNGNMIAQDSYGKNNVTYTATEPGEYQFKAFFHDDVYNVDREAAKSVTVTEAACQHTDFNIKKTVVDHVSLSSTVHQIVYKAEYVCNACDELFNTVERLEPPEAIEEHTFGENRHCTKCNALDETPCPHPQNNIVSTETDRQRFNNNDSDTHGVNVYYTDTCTLCNEDVATDRIEYETENHNFDNGACTICGMIQPPPPHTCTPGEEQKLTRYVNENSPDGHIFVTEIEVYCTGCGQLLDSDEEKVSQPHTFENGQCVCEYKCKHGSTDVSSVISDYRQNTADDHLIITQTTTTCKICGRQVGDAEETSESEKHTLENGKCKVCGYECTHGSTDASSVISDYRQNTADDHLVITQTTTTCKICGRQVGDVKETSAPENHSFENGKCKLCNASEPVTLPPATDVPVTEAPPTDEPVPNTPAPDAPATDEPADEPIPDTPVPDAPATDEPADEPVPDTPVPDAPATDEPADEPVPDTPVPDAPATDEPVVTECPHTDYHWKPTSDNTYEILDDNQHRAFYSAIRKCNLCQEEFGNEDSRRYKTSAHALDENGVCECGYCEHKNITIQYNTNHPHEATSAICNICSRELDTIGIAAQISIDCCQCGYHTWGHPVADGSQYRQYCGACGTSMIVEVPDEQKIADQFTSYNQLMTETNDPFSVIGSAAIGKLQEESYVYTNETINATSDVSETIVDSTIDFFTGRDNYEEAKIAHWEYLITQMLVRNPDYGYAEEANDIRTDKIIRDLTEEQSDNIDWYLKVVDFWAGQYDKKIGQLSDEISKLKTLIDNGSATAENVNDFTKLNNQLDEILQIQTDLSHISENDNVPDAVSLIEIAANGVVAWNDVSAEQNDYMELIAYYSANSSKLNSLITAAESEGMIHVAEAAKRVKANLDLQSHKSLDELNAYYASEKTASTLISVGENMASELLSQALENLPVINAIGWIGQTADLLTNWGDSYESAQTLMMLRDMDNGIGDSVDRAMAKDAENAYYLAELYNVLQIEGLNQTKQFLSDYEKGNWLSTSEFGIHDLNAYQEMIDNRIESRISQQEYLYKLYRDMQQ